MLVLREELRAEARTAVKRRILVSKGRASVVEVRAADKGERCSRWRIWGWRLGSMGLISREESFTGDGATAFGAVVSFASERRLGGAASTTGVTGSAYFGSRHASGFHSG